MKLFPNLAAAALLAAAPLTASAEEVTYGNQKCMTNTSGCVIFSGPMTAEKLAAAGISFEALVASNDLVDLNGLEAVPPFVWLARS